MDRGIIDDTIGRAGPGINQYLDIMKLLHEVNVAENIDFQSMYKAFYMPERAVRSPEWHKEYFSIMQKGKNTTVNFYDVLNRLYQLSCMVEASFASKLVHTLDTTKPILDRFVYRNTGIGPPAYNAQDKLEPASAVYHDIEEWYRRFIPTEDGKLIIERFNKKEEGKDISMITDLKKIDFVLWKWRDEPFII